MVSCNNKMNLIIYFSYLFFTTIRLWTKKKKKNQRIEVRITFLKLEVPQEVENCMYSGFITPYKEFISLSFM